MSISIRYEKNSKIAKCPSQLGMEKRKNVLIFFSMDGLVVVLYWWNI